MCYVVIVIQEFTNILTGNNPLTNSGSACLQVCTLKRYKGITESSTKQLQEVHESTKLI